MRRHIVLAGPLLLALTAVPGCADLFLSKEERAARRMALETVSRVGVLGASMSAGFGTGRTLADILDAAIRADHELVDTADPHYFRKALELARKSTAELQAQDCTLVVGLDYVFWFAYGKKTLAERRGDLAEGLRLLDDLDGPIFLGDLPDMQGASEEMIPGEAIPPAGELAELNRMIAAWAQGRAHVRILPLSAWVAALKAGKPIELGSARIALEALQVLQGDGLHPTERGQILLAVLCIEALKASMPGFLDEDFVLEPERLNRKLTGRPTAISIEVVDEDQNRLREGTLRLSCDLFWLMDQSLLDQMTLMRYRNLLKPHALSEQNPLEVSGLPADILTGTLGASAGAPGFIPAESVKFRLSPGGTARVRLTLLKARTLEVAVVDGQTGGAVPRASVISRTEEEARSQSFEVPLEKSAPGAAITDSSGRCKIDGLRPGTHTLEVHAEGYVPATLAEAAAGGPTPVSVRLERIEGGSTVTVSVLDPEGLPVPGIGVSLWPSGFTARRVSRTDAQGMARFERVAPGEHWASLRSEWMGFVRERKLHDVKGQPEVSQRSLSLGRNEALTIVLGYLQGPHDLKTQVLDPRGKPAAGLEVHLFGPRSENLGDLAPGGYMAVIKSVTDGGGQCTFRRLEEGRYDLKLGEEEMVRVEVPAAGTVEVRTASGRSES